MTQQAPVALVLGDIDLVRPLAAAGVRCALFALPADPARLSRHVDQRLPWVNHWDQQGAMINLLLEFAARQPSPPVLFPQTNGDLLAVSRHRDRLQGPFRFLLPEPDLVSSLLDKAAFSALAQKAGLPVPRAHRLAHDGEAHPALDLRFPVVVKPLTRHQERWSPIGAAAKARRADDASELERLLPALREHEVDVLVQEAIPGPETAIESYHAYADASGTIVGGFTGRKIRTFPARYGHTTALEITNEPDVRVAGVKTMERLGLRGLVKLDFKRGLDGRLYLLEINTRATLWLNPAAVAGMNLAAVAYADLAGRPRPPLGPLRPGVRWCQPAEDFKAAREAGVPLRRWLRFLATCEARSVLAWDDPRPFLGGVLAPALRRRVGRG